MIAAPQRRALGALLLAALFFAIAAYQIDRPGLQADELLFVQGVWEGGTVALETRVFGHRVPLMQLAYLGSLKSILYQPIFAAFGVSAAAVRLPMVAIAAVTVALTFLLLWRLAGERAAWMGGVLLALDPAFVFTTRCDWGPVAIERLLAVAGLMCFERRRVNLGAFLFGLALWNKTTFLWTLIGLAAAVAAAYPREVRARITLRTAGVALLCFAAGAYPWIRYNVRSRGGTAAATAKFDASDLRGKLFQLRSSLEGTSLYGYLVRDGDGRPWPRAGILPWLVAMAAAWALGSRDRLGLFFVTLLGVSWLAMALTRGAGGSAHHAVLVWPWPHCLLALAGSHWPRRFSAALVLGAALNAGVIARHYVLLEKMGAAPPWSDAVYEMTSQVLAQRPVGVFVNDWGMVEPLLLASRGTLRMEMSTHPALPAGRLAARPGWIFVSHTDALQQFPNVNARWKQVPGFERVMVTPPIRDRQRTPVYEIFRFKPAAPAR
ncbi:MAG: hypothetical protein IT162_14355 [Bryobacterales bacterium]|nr:hypothetical protein [Bryobacterales bacterium]